MREPRVPDGANAALDEPVDGSVSKTFVKVASDETVADDEFCRNCGWRSRCRWPCIPHGSPWALLRAQYGF